MKKTRWMKGTADAFSKLPAGTRIRIGNVLGVVRVRGVPPHLIRRGRGVWLTHFFSGHPWGTWADGLLQIILEGGYEYEKPPRKKRASKATT